MATSITITQRQAPTFRALIKDNEGNFFDVSNHLATAEELEAEGIDAHPAAFSIRRSKSSLTPYDSNTSNSDPVEGYQNVEIDAAAFVEESTVREQELTYNFQYTPPSRARFPFEQTGYYIVDFTIYPKTGAAIVFRVGVTVK